MELPPFRKKPMNKPFKVDSTGLVRDSQCGIVAAITADDVAVREALILRLNLFEDMLRAISLLKVYARDMPAIAAEDVRVTFVVAKSA